MDITGQHTPASENEVTLLTDMQRIQDAFVDINNRLTTLKGVDARDPVVLRFKLRSLSAMQRVVRFVTVKHAANIKGIVDLVRPSDDGKKKNTLVAVASKLVKRKNKRGEVSRKSVTGKNRNFTVKLLSANVKAEIVENFKWILENEKVYYGLCFEWYSEFNVKIKQSVEEANGRTSSRDLYKLSNVMKDLEATLQCLNEFLATCKREKVDFDKIYGESATQSAIQPS